MYVKVHSYPVRIIEAEGDTVLAGSRHWWSDYEDQGPIADATLQDMIEWLDQTADFYDRSSVDPDEFAGYRDGDESKPFWQIRWVKYQSIKGPWGILFATCPIYVLGSNGKTIDRV